MQQAAIRTAMATPEVWTPSSRMRAAAAAEHSRLDRELERLAARERELQDEWREIRAARAELEREVVILNRLRNSGHQEPTPRLRALKPSARGDMTVLRGAQIREVAVRLLASTAEPDKPVHYRALFDLVVARGFMPAGKDPLASFLTQLRRSPLVQSTTTAGVYTLDLGFLDSARHRLSALRHEFAEAAELSSDADLQDIDRDRKRRASLSAEIEATEKQLQEAHRSLSLYESS
jgi:hypothetical protein